MKFYPIFAKKAGVGKEEKSNMNKMYSVGKEVFLIDNLVAVPPYAYTFEFDMIVIVVCTKGYARGHLNLKPYISQTPSITVSRPGEILQYEHVSEDFSGFVVVMSKQFAGSLLTDMQERFLLRLALADNPCLPLNSPELKTALDYCCLLKKTREVEELSLRREIVKHLTLAFYYTMTYQLQIRSGDAQRPKAHVLLDRFIKLVQEHFREQRSVGFYADRMCLTPRYLSKVIRDDSGASAGEWIDSYVVLEAKELLKSTNMTIQQISDDLNFPSQSFFGKYFKRIVGVSPQKYRKG
ncbi:MAG: AraC family transcriptional regulator [Prevotellaceae bacterium]|jgi:AraC-like DNA-binding protein|nr:AraC family transcriptional regulator [Prevotellaceae bacterium]